MRTREMSSINEIIARDPEKAMEADIEFAQNFANQDEEYFKGKNELKKSEEQIKIINLANEETNKLREKYGLNKFDIGPDYVHLFRYKDYINLVKNKSKNPYDSMGIHDARDQMILANQKFSSPKLAFAMTAFHEFIHLKAKQTAYVTKNGTVIGEAGISNSLNPENKDTKSYFKNLNEAITEELTKKFKKNILKNHPDFQNDFNLIKEFIDQEKKSGRNIFEDEIIGATKKITYSADNRKETIKIKAIPGGYEEAMDVLNMLIDDLYEKNQERFQDREEIFDLFAKSIFTGNIVGKGSWGRLIEATYGNGTLKQLAEKDDDLEELYKFVENLKATNKQE